VPPPAASVGAQSPGAPLRSALRSHSSSRPPGRPRRLRPGRGRPVRCRPPGRRYARRGRDQRL